MHIIERGFVEWQTFKDVARHEDIVGRTNTLLIRARVNRWRDHVEANHIAIGPEQRLLYRPATGAGSHIEHIMRFPNRRLNIASSDLAQHKVLEVETVDLLHIL